VLPILVPVRSYFFYFFPFLFSIEEPQKNGPKCQKVFVYSSIKKHLTNLHRIIDNEAIMMEVEWWNEREGEEDEASR
jgi:hypothetical protein